MMKHIETQRTAREQYAAPQLKRWGTVTDLTRAGFTNGGGDPFFNEKKGINGSVNAPGFDTAPGFGQ